MNPDEQHMVYEQEPANNSNPSNEWYLRDLKSDRFLQIIAEKTALMNRSKSPTSSRRTESPYAQSPTATEIIEPTVVSIQIQDEELSSITEPRVEVITPPLESQLQSSRAQSRDHQTRDQQNTDQYLDTASDQSRYQNHEIKATDSSRDPKMPTRPPPTPPVASQADEKKSFKNYKKEKTKGREREREKDQTSSSKSSRSRSSENRSRTPENRSKTLRLDKLIRDRMSKFETKNEKNSETREQKVPKFESKTEKKSETREQKVPSTFKKTVSFSNKDEIRKMS